MSQILSINFKNTPSTPPYFCKPLILTLFLLYRIPFTNSHLQIFKPTFLTPLCFLQNVSVFPNTQIAKRAKEEEAKRLSELRKRQQQQSALDSQNSNRMRTGSSFNRQASNAYGAGSSVKKPQYTVSVVKDDDSESRSNRNASGLNSRLNRQTSQTSP